MSRDGAGLPRSSGRQLRRWHNCRERGFAADRSQHGWQPRGRSFTAVAGGSAALRGLCFYGNELAVPALYAGVRAGTMMRGQPTGTHVPRRRGRGWAPSAAATPGLLATDHGSGDRCGERRAPLDRRRVQVGSAGTTTILAGGGARTPSSTSGMALAARNSPATRPAEPCSRDAPPCRATAMVVERFPSPKGGLHGTSRAID